MKASRSQFLELRGLRYHVRQWGPQNASPQRTLLMLHGWMDVSASFQFVVDALDASWRVLAPDWRGFGLSDNSGADTYWFPDYQADLDLLVDQVLPAAPVQVVGHSMGGNIAMLYAGIRPQRVSAVINIEGFGLQQSKPDEAPVRYARWLDQIKAGATMRDYASLNQVAARLQKNNPRLADARALYLAAHWARQGADGRFQIAGDPVHRYVNPVGYQLDDTLACWTRIASPVLWISANETEVLKHVAGAAGAAAVWAEIERRKAYVPDISSVRIDGAGHMIHHDQPEQLAAHIERFLGRPALID